MAIDASSKSTRTVFHLYIGDCEDNAALADAFEAVDIPVGSYEHDAKEGETVFMLCPRRGSTFMGGKPMKVNSEDGKAIMQVLSEQGIRKVEVRAK